MFVVVGLILLVAAVVVGVAGVLTNADSAHTLTDDFSVFGFHAGVQRARCSSTASWSVRSGSSGSACCWPGPAAPLAAVTTRAADSSRHAGKRPRPSRNGTTWSTSATLPAPRDRAAR